MSKSILLDKTTLEPCPINERLMCTITDKNHRHVFSHMVTPDTPDSRPADDVPADREAAIQELLHQHDYPEYSPLYSHGLEVGIRAGYNTATARLTSALADAEKERDVYKKALEYYADPKAWACNGCLFDELHFECEHLIWSRCNEKTNGYDIAQAALKDADKGEGNRSR